MKKYRRLCMWGLMSRAWVKWILKRWRQKRAVDERSRDLVRGDDLVVLLVLQPLGMVVATCREMRGIEVMLMDADCDFMP